MEWIKYPKKEKKKKVEAECLPDGMLLWLLLPEISYVFSSCVLVCWLSVAYQVCVTVNGGSAMYDYVSFFRRVSMLLVCILCLDFFLIKKCGNCYCDVYLRIMVRFLNM